MGKKVADDCALGLACSPKGDHLFTTTFGTRSVSGFSKARERLDKITGPLPHWVIHDLRRTMRSHLEFERLGTRERVAESMIAHAPPGIIGTYVVYKYLDEKRRGFAAWHERLSEILSAAPSGGSNVVALHRS